METELISRYLGTSSFGLSGLSWLGLTSSSWRGNTMGAAKSYEGIGSIQTVTTPCEHNNKETSRLWRSQWHLVHHSDEGFGWGPGILFLLSMFACARLDVAIECYRSVNQRVRSLQHYQRALFPSTAVEKSNRMECRLSKWWYRCQHHRRSTFLL